MVVACTLLIWAEPGRQYQQFAQEWLSTPPDKIFPFIKPKKRYDNSSSSATSTFFHNHDSNAHRCSGHSRVAEHDEHGPEITEPGVAGSDVAKK